MEHGNLLTKVYNANSNQYNLDNNLMAYVGYKAASESQSVANLFSPNSLKKISEKITYLLRGVDPQGKKIVVTDKVISNVLSSVLNSYQPVVGDIYSRYQVMNEELYRNDVQQIIDETINIIVGYVRNEIGMEENNKKLTIWTTILGDFNKHGLRQHAPIKVQKRRPDPMLFNMNY